MSKACSLALVAAQFACILLILVRPRGWQFTLDASSIAALLLCACAIVLGVWALSSMRRSSFSVLPEPTTSSILCTTGAYKIVRHPMYLAVLLLCTGAALIYMTLTKWLVLGLLCMVLAAKIYREERYLHTRYGDAYVSYASRISAVIPRLSRTKAH